ncbi:MAG: hypothetical protein UD936_05110 [Acutalibacteraceae bacterium]|nr:hypothetical protein [Acutalibacteraceae bacterium]
MKNSFKKTAGIMIASSMLCAIMATGCTASKDSTADSNIATENNTTTESATEVTSTTATEAVTEVTTTATEAATESATEASTESATASDGSMLTQQTLVDEITGIEVSGMIPEGVELYTTAYILSTLDLSEGAEFPYYPDSWFPKLTKEYYEYELSQGERTAPNIQKTINKKGWAEWEAYAGGMIGTTVYFVKGTDVINFNSELTVTVPFNYRRGLVTGGINDEAVVVEYDYNRDVREFSYVEVTPEESTPKGSFQYKISRPGLSIMGGKTEISDLVEFFDRGKVTLEHIL